jgi:hypothetical protein
MREQQQQLDYDEQLGGDDAEYDHRCQHDAQQAHPLA